MVCKGYQAKAYQTKARHQDIVYVGTRVSDTTTSILQTLLYYLLPSGSKVFCLLHCYPSETISNQIIRRGTTV